MHGQAASGPNFPQLRKHNKSPDHCASQHQHPPASLATDSSNKYKYITWDSAKQKFRVRSRTEFLGYTNKLAEAEGASVFGRMVSRGPYPCTLHSYKFI